MESDIPGFYRVGNRYFAAPKPGGPAAPRPRAAPSTPSSTSAKVVAEQKRRKRRPRLHDATCFAPSLLATSRSTPLQLLPRVSHNLRLAHYAGLDTSEMLLPDCFALDDTITAVCIDGNDPDLLRIGTLGGSLAQGRRQQLGVPSVYDWENVSPWRLNWQFAAPIRTLRSHGARFLAASFGPPASAMFATSESSASLASVVLNPRQTSIWSCALAADFLALGCDEAILLSHDPLSSSMRSLKTGSAALALDAHDNTLIYGLRSGLVAMSDVRDHKAQQLSLSLDAPITHLHANASTADLVTATFGGQVRIYDVRHLRKPRLTLRGHRNTCSTELGMVVCDDLLVAAGDDARLRGWSMLTGEPVRTTVEGEPPVTPLFGRTFDEPVRSMTYSPAHGQEDAALYVAEGGGLERYALPR